MIELLKKLDWIMPVQIVDCELIVDWQDYEDGEKYEGPLSLLYSKLLKAYVKVDSFSSYNYSYERLLQYLTQEEIDQLENSLEFKVFTSHLAEVILLSQKGEYEEYKNYDSTSTILNIEKLMLG